MQETWLRLSRSDTSERREPATAGSRRWSAGCAWTCCARARSRREQPFDAHVPDPIVSRAEGGAIPSTRRCWPTRSASRCSWCSMPSRPPNGSPSCCTTCSACLSTRSRRSSGARRQRRGSLQAAPGGASRARPGTPNRIAAASRRWSTHSWRRRARAISCAAGGARSRHRAARRWWPC